MQPQNKLTWITDRPPTEKDAHPVNASVLVLVKNEPRLYDWAGIPPNTPWLPLNDLPEVPKPKTQAELDEDACNRWYASSAYRAGTRPAWLAACAYARSDLKRQVREIIAEDDSRCISDSGPGISHYGGRKLRELVKE